jgi:exopolyphosphatase/guanosine-5'-triphosphate,3'-diphosphate pyrophosphatase
MSSKHANVAIIDMGTNTFHLLIAEMSSRPKILVREREAVKVGQGGINKKIITTEGFARALDAIRKFKTIIDQHGVRKTLAFGTSAIRNASNGQELVDSIRNNTGIDTRIIDGDEEADLIYRGVRAGLDLGTDSSLIIDIGGGSVEFIVGNNHGVQWKKSLDIGGQRLLEQFQKHDPITPEEVHALETFLGKELRPFMESLKEFDPKTLVGVSGTFDTLSEVFCIRNGLPYYPDDSETPFDINACPPIYKDLLTHDRAGRLALPGMIEMRVDMIVVACVLVNFILHVHQFDNIRVSSYSLKEGVLASLLPS